MPTGFLTQREAGSAGDKMKMYTSYRKWKSHQTPKHINNQSFKKENIQDKQRLEAPNIYIHIKASIGNSTYQYRHL